MTISTSEFIGLARNSMESFGAPDQAFVVVPHPLGMIPKEEVIKKVDAAFPEILKAATAWKPSRTTIPGLGKPAYPAETVKFTGSYQDLLKMMYDKRWSIGLPVVPPTKTAVQAMLKGTSHKPDEVVWDAVPPRMGVLTAELVAAHGVMASCKPEMMPVLLATIEAMKDPATAWRSSTTTTHPVAPMIIVSGPIAKQLGIASGLGAMGPEMPANLCIGHFVNLIGDVVGGSWPPEGDMTTQGWVGNTLATVAAENIEGNPWKQSYAEERGFKATDNVVFFHGGPAPLMENDHASVEPQDLAELLAYTMNSVGSSRCFSSGGIWLFAPEHAQTLASKGWTKKDVQQFLWKNANAPFFAQPPLAGGKCAITTCCPDNFPKDFLAKGPITDNTLIPAVEKPEQIILMVVGGAGKQSLYFPIGFGPSPLVAKKIDAWK